VELVLAIKAHNPRVPDALILSYAQQEERHGGLMLTLPLPQLLAHLQDFLSSLDGHTE
jgi:hypothetical protein